MAAPGEAPSQALSRRGWAFMCQRCQAFDTLDWLSPSPIGAFIADPPLGGPAPERPEIGAATDVDRPNPEGQSTIRPDGIV